jgi:hypothetical protein
VRRIWRESDTQYNCVCCESLGTVIEVGTDRDYYCVCYDFPGEENRERNIY